MPYLGILEEPQQTKHLLLQKEKIKKNKTNPNALTSVLKTLEKVKETQKQKQIAENEKI